MIKKLIRLFLKHRIWLISIMLYNIMFGIFLWLIDARRFTYVFPNIVLGSLLVFCLIGFIIYGIDIRKKEAIEAFIENPDILEEVRLNNLSPEEKEMVHAIGEKLREKEELINRQKLNLTEYEEYVEMWAHEVKAPLALMTFVLGNRKQEISAAIYQRLEYIRNEMQEDIERMLYYARVKAGHIDYQFTEISLNEICSDVIDEYKNFTAEEKIKIMNEVEDIKVLSDKKGLLFVLRQIISNAVKYRSLDAAGSFIILLSEMDKRRENIILTIRDNGIGVKSYDIPFLFDKGFTGDAGQKNKHSTGMGLYLAEQVAHHLKIKIKISEDYKDGLEISVLFPVI